MVLVFCFLFLGRPLLLLLLFGTRQLAGVGCGEWLVGVGVAAIPVGRADGRVGGRSGARKRSWALESSGLEYVRSAAIGAKVVLSRLSSFSFL